MAKLFTGAETIDDWNPLDGVPAPSFIPVQWNGPHVGVRLTDAWHTLARMPLPHFYPREFGHCWPHYRVEWDDLLSMIGAGEFEAQQRQWNRVRILPSAKEISQMEQAIIWPLKYLKGEIITIVNICSHMNAIDGDLQSEIKRKRHAGDAEDWRKRHWRACDQIANGLIRDHVVVF